MPSGLPALALPPAIPFSSHQELWPAALMLALISFTEAMSSCRVLSRKTGERWDENQELIGQGLAKMTSAVSGAFPVSGSISRSALNLYAGATGPWASLFAAACVLLSLFFLLPLIAFLPYSVLAAMIMVPVFNLLDVRAFGRLFRISRDDGMVALVTLVVTLASSPRLHYGVIAGVGLTMVSFLYRRTHPRIVEVALHGDGTLRDRKRFDLAPIAPDVLAVRIDSAVNFLTASAFERFITEQCSANPEVRSVLICASGINDIDASGVEMIESLHAALRGEGLELYLAAVKKQVSDVLERAGFFDELGRTRLFATDAAAVAAFRRAAIRGAEARPGLFGKVDSGA
jgi:sulfate permease, SulP family